MFICRNNKDMFRDIAVFRPTILVMVPALAEMALALSRRFGRNMLGEDLRSIICGAAAVPPYLIAEYDKLGVALFPGYGLTETANLVSGNPRNTEKPDSVGLPYPDQELRIVDGELWLKGRNLMDGYVGSEEDAWTADGWFRTGDLARFDEDGYLYITGRIKEIIVLPNGENVSPAEVETAFLACTLIQDCQVFEDLDGQRHILALEVVPRAAEMAKLPEEEAGKRLMDALERINAALPEYQRVSRITVRTTDFERTKSMKIVRYHKCK
jgi:long-chain acyl-CoA synthetase